MPLPDKKESQDDLSFTGERFIPHQTDPLLALEHYHRYFFASRLVRDKRILDIACGEGYGSALLSQWAKEVVGIDGDDATIHHARARYASIPNLRFEAGRCEDTFRDKGMFDAVVSFELIEHLDAKDQVGFLANVREVLKAEGLLIISSPERYEYAATYQSANKFHKHELTLAELQAFLKNQFKYVHLCAQRVLCLSAMWQLEGWRGAQFHFHPRQDLVQDIPVSEAFAEPLYLIAVCSDAPIPDEIIEQCNSFYLDTSSSDHAKRFAKWALMLNEESQKNGAVIRSLREQLDQHRKQLQDQSDAYQRQLDEQKKQLEERAAWAWNLEGRVKAQSEFIETLNKDLDGRTRWALSLQSDVEMERAHAKDSSRELLRLRELMSASIIYRALAKLKLLPNAWGK